MDAALVVLQKTGVMFLLMVAGWWAFRRGWMGPDMLRGLGRFVVDLAFPALVFTQMLRTVSLPALRQGWWIPLAAVPVIAGSAWIGRLAGRAVGVSAPSRRTFAFVVAIPNWVFLPLPIADALYGADGMRFVLLFNVGAQVMLWTEGVRMLRGGPVGREALRGLAGNPGVLATVGGIAVATLVPSSAGWGGQGAANLRSLPIDALIGALRMLGDLTIPLSLLATGAQLGARPAAGRAEGRVLAAVLVSRLIVAPLACMAVFLAVARAVGWAVPEATFITATVVVAMPVAISCGMFVERFGGDPALSANAIFLTTLVSLLTVPVLVLLAHRLV